MNWNKTSSFSSYWTVELRPQGPGRLPGAVFLGVWLVGWAFGEVFALLALLITLLAAIAPELIPEWINFHGAGSGWGVMATILFLLVWLTFWTIGGIAAHRQFYQMMWGREVVSADPGGILTVFHYGLFSTRTRVPREGLRAIRLGRQKASLVADSGDKQVAIASLGTLEQRIELRDRLHKSLGLEPTPAWPASGEELELPPGWEAAHDVDGTPFLRLGKSRFAWIRYELSTRSQNLTIRTGIAKIVHTHKFVNPRLQVEFTEDGDGDKYFRLVVHSDSSKRVIVARMDDARDPILLGRWLADKLEIELEIDSEVKKEWAA